MPKRTPEKNSVKPKKKAARAKPAKKPKAAARPAKKAASAKTAKKRVARKSLHSRAPKRNAKKAAAKSGRAAADRVILFVGPTMAGSAPARALAKGYVLRRPIRRHDVDMLVAAEQKAGKKPGTMVIVDGVFHDTLAVGHAEIRDALAAGWTIWGLSSMGAIRAREMMHLGMRGFGRVFERFCGEDDFQDDEVALLHEPAAPYRGVSEPLIHLREAVDHLVARDVVAADDAHAVIADLKGRWYGERTLARLRHTVKQRPGVDPAAVDRELGDLDRFRLKTLDLLHFLTERPFARA